MTTTTTKSEELIKTLWCFRSFYDSDIREMRWCLSTSVSKWHDSASAELHSLRTRRPSSLRIGFLEQHLQSIEAVGGLADQLATSAIYVRFETTIKGLIETGVPNAVGCADFTWTQIETCLK
jgi:hypothetical protein